MAYRLLYFWSVQFLIRMKCMKCLKWNSETDVTEAKLREVLGAAMCAGVRKHKSHPTLRLAESLKKSNATKSTFQVSMSF